MWHYRKNRSIWIQRCLSNPHNNLTKKLGKCKINSTKRIKQLLSRFYQQNIP